MTVWTKAVPRTWLVTVVAGLGVMGGQFPVLLVLGPADEAPATAAGGLSELGHIDMDRRA